MYLKGYDLENSKNMLLHNFDNLLPWKQSKMATKHNYLKSLKLQSDCMQINFLFSLYKHNAIFSFTKDFVWLLCFSFIVLFTFYACKNYTNISDQHKTKTNITIYKSLGKSKDQYIYTQHAHFQDSFYSKRSLRVLQLRKRCKSENVRKCM